MKKKLSFDYDKESGVMIAQLRVGGKTYFGTAVKHPDDPFPPSFSIGEKIAGARAYISMYNDKLEEKRIELKVIKRILNSMPPDNPGIKYVFGLLDAINQEYENLIYEREECRHTIATAIEARELFIRSRTTDKKERQKKLDELGEAIKQLGQDKNN